MASISSSPDRSNWQRGSKVILIDLDSQGGGHMGLAGAASPKKNDVPVLPNVTVWWKTER